MEAVSPDVGLFIAKPRILEGEHITGYAARLTAFSTLSSKVLTMGLQGKQGNKPAWVLPSGLERLVTLLHPGLPAADVLLSEHTLYPLFRPFLPPEAAEALRAHSLGTAVPGIAATCGLSAYGVSGRYSRAVCKACLADDCVAGQPYWRRSHFIPGIVICPTHAQPLYTYCDSCIAGFRKSIGSALPNSRCACGAELVAVRSLGTEEEKKAEVGIACLAGEMLSSRPFQDLNHEQILAAISNRAKKYGHGGPRGVIRVRTILEQRIGQQTLNAHQFRTSAENFHMALLGRKLPRNATQNIIMIYGLFDNLADFIESAQHNARGITDPTVYCDGSGQVKKRRLGRLGLYGKWGRMPHEELEQVRARARRKALHVKRANPGINRTNFSKTSREAAVAYLFLVRFDGRWLDETFPRHLPAFRISDDVKSRHSRTDVSLANHIYARRAELMRASILGRVTRRRLLQGHEMESVGRYRLARFKNANSALDACVESSQEWQIRQTVLLLKRARSISPEAPFDFDSTLPNLSIAQLKNLQRRICRWLARH